MVPPFQTKASKYPYKKQFSNLPRKNKQIRAREVRVIGADGKQIGVLALGQALLLASEAGLDLVEISPKAQPPVCKILDFGKYMYEESKKTKAQKTTAAKLKEIKLGASIEKNDYLTKLRQAESFLFKGNKVKLYINLKGRQMSAPQLGVEVVQRMADDLKGVGLPDAKVTLSGRNIFVLLTPLPTAKRVLVHSKKDELMDESEG
jgi:translation initiation factor IF-3